MKDEYDFSSGKRGKFFRVDAVLVPPVQFDSAKPFLSNFTVRITYWLRAFTVRRRERRNDR